MEKSYEFNELGRKIFEQRYAQSKDEKWCTRVKKICEHVANAEEDSDRELWRKKFSTMLNNGDFIPGGRIIFGSGRGAQNLLNCYQISPEDSVESIGKLIADMYKISCGGGGIGFNFSNIRPKGDTVRKMPFSAPGSVSVMKMLNEIGNHVRAGANRRTALIAILNVDHPDLIEFLNVKLDLNQLNNFNISVGVTQEFLEAAENNRDWFFTFQGVRYYVYSVERVSKNGEREIIEVVGCDEEDVIGRALAYHRVGVEDRFENPVRKEYKAKDLWNRIWENSVKSGDPGIFNISLANKFTNVSYFEFLPSTNPCLFGSMKVAVANGDGDLSIEELAKNGKDVPVFCLDSKNKVTVRMMRNPRKTGTKVETFKITLDDGNSVICTPNHKWLMTDGSSKQTDELLPGDSLHLTTKFLSTMRDVTNNKFMSNSSDYVWFKNNNQKAKSEHRLIAEFNQGPIPYNCVVHHKDFNSQNNRNDNLQIMTRDEHTKLHSLGENNPMIRAKTEWSEEKWDKYKKNMSILKSGEGNGNSLEVTHEEIKSHAISLTRSLGRRFSRSEWINYAKENTLPQSFAGWRKNHLGGVKGLAIWAANKLGFENVDLDIKTQRKFIDLTNQGYACEIINNQVHVLKNCEHCGEEFSTAIREVAYCGTDCSTEVLNSREIQETAFKNRMTSLGNRKEKDALSQLEVYSKLKFNLGRDPLKKEWESECRNLGIRFRLGNTSPFKTYGELAERALTFNHKVKSVEFYGYEDVYNGTVDDFHNFLVGGFESVDSKGKVVKSYLTNFQCGEIPLPNYGNCCLGHVNLTNFVDEYAQFDWSRFAITVRLGVRFLDDVLTVNSYPIPETREIGAQSRRIGLGLMGYHYALIKLGIKYGSEKCLEFTERLMATMRNEAYLSSVYLARDKGAFPKFDAKKFLSEDYSRELPYRIRQVIKRHGVRNAVMLTLAPTGTISLMFGVSSGIEPIFAPIYKRRYREANVWREEYVMDPLLKEFIDKGKSIENFVGAYDVTPEEHLAVQAVFQKYIDSAISKTINLPATAKAEDFSDIALEYAKELKGLTVYRAGSKGNEPLEALPLTKENIQKALGNTNLSEGFCKLGDNSCGS